MRLILIILAIIGLGYLIATFSNSDKDLAVEDVKATMREAADETGEAIDKAAHEIDKAVDHVERSAQ